jgi:ribosomal protein S18 acetylase RimI-like enzyme
MNPVIRELREADFATIRARVDAWWGRPVQGSLLRLFFEHFLPMSRAAEVPAREQPGRALPGKATAGDIVGFIVGFQSQTHPAVAYAHYIAVAPEYREQGLARRLYEVFFAEARARGCTTIECITAPINARSIAFHQRLGFELIPSPNLIEGVPVCLDHDGPGRHHVRMRRSL